VVAVELVVEAHLMVIQVQLILVVVVEGVLQLLVVVMVVQVL
tara:strand:+ start:605 stop:730 length:126 start_codon:yes stop_codon:yes gene_type:complete